MFIRKHVGIPIQSFICDDFVGIYMTHHTYLFIMTQHTFSWFYLHLCMLTSSWSVFLAADDLLHCSFFLYIHDSSHISVDHDSARIPIILSASLHAGFFVICFFLMLMTFLHCLFFLSSERRVKRDRPVRGTFRYYE